jgi:hypothetical protein
MKLKTIKQIVSAKFNSWANSITDERVRKMVMENTVITGGCLVSLLTNEKVNDFDLYFRNHDTCLAVAEYYARAFPNDVSIRDEDGRITIQTTPQVVYQGDEEASDESEEGETYTTVYFSSNAITLTGKVQIVVRFYGEPGEIHANYDFVHCTCYWSSWDEKLVTPVEALNAIMGKELVYVGSKYPLCSLIRIRKFIARGWTIGAGQMLKIVIQLQALDLFDIKILQDQLVGVDSAYFARVIQELKKSGKERVGAPYLLEIIDRMY